MRVSRLLIPAAALLILLGVAIALHRSSPPEPVHAAKHPLGTLPAGRKPLIFDLGAEGQDPTARVAALDEVKSLGANAVRVVISWGAVAPQHPPKGFQPTNPRDPNYNFTDLDAYLREINSRGLKILLSASSPFPKFASASGNSDISDPRPSDYGAFMRALAKRYSGGFDPDGPKGPRKPLPGAAMWSVWNEPNLALFLQPVKKGGKPYSPGLYRRLFKAAQKSILAEDPGAQILIGETAPTGGDAGIDPIPFAREVLCLNPDLSKQAGCQGGPISAAGWSTHPYGISTNPPFEAPGNRGFVTIDLLGDLESVLQGAAAAGTTTRTLPVYISEFGIQSQPDPLVGVTPAHQADYLSISERFAYADPNVASFAQYLLRDDSPFQVPGQTYGGFESGLRTYGGAPKPALNALRTPLAVQRIGDRVSLWGLVQPAHGSTTVRIRYEDSDGSQGDLGRFRTDGASVFTHSFPFEIGRRWRIEWTDPSGKTYRGPLTPAYAYGVPTP